MADKIDSNGSPGEPDAAARRQRDFDDFNNELADRETGRPRRFLPPGAHPDSVESKRRDRHSALQRMLLSSTAYARLHSDTMDRLREAERAAEEALAETAEALEQAGQDYRDGLDGASTLPDGTRVFRDAEGNVYAEDGRLVEGGELDQIEWRAGAIGYGEFLARKQALEDAQQRYDALLHYRVDVLGNARNRLSDPDNPLSPEELGEIQQQIEAGAHLYIKQAALDPAEAAVETPLVSSLGTNIPPMDK